MAKSEIDWTDDSWNPVTGCTHGCTYCYARQMAARLGDREFRPTVHRDRMTRYKPLAKPRDVFLCSMGDLYDPEVRPEWREAVFDLTLGSQHRFIVLTKRPDLIGRCGIPELRNLLMGVTVTGNADAWRVHSLCASPGNRFVSFEPLHGPCDEVDIHGLDWVIIGAETRNGRTVRWPEPAWVEDITRRAVSLGIPVFHKENLGSMATLHDRATVGLMAPALF